MVCAHEWEYLVGVALITRNCPHCNQSEILIEKQGHPATWIVDFRKSRT